MIRYYRRSLRLAHTGSHSLECKASVTFRCASSFCEEWKGRKTARTHFVFGANTDVGKTVATAALIRACGPNTADRLCYTKPLQCGGDDQAFVQSHVPWNFRAQTLFKWDSPVSPHSASRIENKPVSDSQIIDSLSSVMQDEGNQIHWIETAGGVLSPAASSPKNTDSAHAGGVLLDKGCSSFWGWRTQADLYKPFASAASVVLVGDSRLGGISVTLASLESLTMRGYVVDGMIFVESSSLYENHAALLEYASRKRIDHGVLGGIFQNPAEAIVSLPRLPELPEPLHQWYDIDSVAAPLRRLNHFLDVTWQGRCAG